MEIIDCQVHVIDKDRPERPWVPGFADALKNMPGGDIFLAGAAIITDDEMIKVMDETGVDGAILVPTSHYGFDNSYSVEAARKRPTRFRVAGLMNPAGDDVEDRMQAWAEEPMAVGIRMRIGSAAQVEGSHFDRMLTSAAETGMPVSVICTGFLPSVAALARRFPGVPFSLDHLGMPQPPMEEPGPEPLRDFPQLLQLAQFPNVSVKISGIPALSLEPYPWADLNRPLRRLIEAFGTERLMWGTDWTRVVHLFSYKDSLRFITESPDLDEAEKAALLAGSLRNHFRWPADQAAG